MIRLGDAGRKLEENISLMSKCLISTAITLLIGLATYIAIREFGLYEYLSKLHIAMIPSAALGILTCTFIWLNRKFWKDIVTKATFAHFVTWTAIIFLFIISSEQFRLLIYFLGFLLPTAWINLVKPKKVPPLPYSLFLGLHGGIGAYCMVVLLNFLLSFAGIPLPVSPSKILFGHVIPKDAILTILPYETLASIAPVYLVVLYACFIEEIMFRLPLSLFKKFGMYPMAFLISFLFIYLHALSRLSLDPVTLVQVLICIAFANAIFIAVYTRTLCIWCSVVAHMIYNMMVLAQVPLVAALAILMFNGVLHILLAKMGLVKKE